MIETISTQEAAKLLRYKDHRSLKKWCKRYALAIICGADSNRHFLIRSEFEIAHRKMILANYPNFSERTATDCIQLQNYSSSSLDLINPRATLRHMEEPLFIPPGKRMRGLGLCVFCYKCQTNVIDICHEKNVSLKKCSYGDQHVFKVYKYLKGTKQRKTKKLETRDVNEAIQQAITFGKSVNNNSIEVSHPEIKQMEAQGNKRAPLIVDSIDEYLKWLHGIGVPEHLKKFRSEDFIGEVERKLKIFKECLEKNGHDLSLFTVDQLNDTIVGEFYSYLKEQKRFGSNTFNKHLSYATSWLKWFSKEKYPVRNWFADVKRKPSNHNPLAISEEEYSALLRETTLAKGVQQDSHGKKIQYYRYWLPDAFRLGLETGRRREEILKLKFSGITCDKNDRPEFILVEDFKVNRSQNRFTEEEKKYVRIPVTDSLHQLLLELNYEKYKGSDRYILAPEESFQRTKAMRDTISRGFAHYIKKVTDRPLSFKCLRKTYITSLSLFLGGNAKVITGHSTDAVIERYYLANEPIARKAKGLSVFNNERTEELNEIRNKQSHQKLQVAK